MTDEIYETPSATPNFRTDLAAQLADLAPEAVADGKFDPNFHQAIAEGLKRGTLRPVIGQRMPLADAAKAHAAVLEPGAYGKIVLLP